MKKHILSLFKNKKQLIVCEPIYAFALNAVIVVCESF